MSTRQGSDRLTEALKLVGVIALGVAAVALYLVFRQPAGFGMSAEGFVERWNSAAAPELLIGEVQWTDPEAGVFGFAFTPTLSVLARVDGPYEQVVDIAVVGEPASDGEDLVLEAMELVVAVTEPELDATDRRDVLQLLSLVNPNRPARPDDSVVVGETRYRVAADVDRGVIGIGARPAGSES